MFKIESVFETWYHKMQRQGGIRFSERRTSEDYELLTTLWILFDIHFNVWFLSEVSFYAVFVIQRRLLGLHSDDQSHSKTNYRPCWMLKKYNNHSDQAERQLQMVLKNFLFFCFPILDVNQLLLFLFQQNFYICPHFSRWTWKQFMSS